MGSRAASLVLAALCASALPVAGRAEGARVLFGAGLSLGGVTFAPSAFSSNWAGYNAMGTGEPQPVSRGPDSSGAATIAAAFKEKAPEKFAEMKEDVKEAADKAKSKFDDLVSKKDGEAKA